MLLDTTQLDYSLIKEVSAYRNIADHSIEQYLMTPESLYLQLNAIGSYLRGKRVLFLGDDDYLSIFLSYFFEVKAFVLELDTQILIGHQYWKKALNLNNHEIVSFDLRNSLDKSLKGSFDCFCANPPYSSKNEGFGIKVWISRGLFALKEQGIGLLILPICSSLKWSLKNILTTQRFLAENNAFVFKIDPDLHTYEDLPDKGLRSSNIWVYYLGGAKSLIEEVQNKNLYR